ncbi:LysR family transcriptional regulator [Paenibacillus flagellatus]|nr:LysR family transcriptional regulator [Paenibacillus flagellatus]
MSAMDHYKVFYRAVKTGSLTKAAEELYMTQPSASYAIRQLEEQLGAKLLVRRSKGVEPTGEGRVLFDYVERAFGLLQAGERKIGEMKSYGAGIVRLGASDSLCKHYVLPLLESFRARYPGIRIQLSHGKSEDIAKRLAEGAVDCGIVHLPAGDGARITASRPIRDCFAAGPAFAELAAKPIEWRELARQPFVLLSASSRTRTFLRAWMQSHGAEIEPDIELGSVDLLVEFAAKNIGVCFVTRDFIRRELESGELIEIRTVEPIPERSIGVVSAPGASLSIAASLFVDELSRHIASG